jgi:hypothetical protein
LIFQRDTAFQLALPLTMRRIATTLAVVGALLFSAGAAWADWEDDWSNAWAEGWVAHQRGDYATPLKKWRPLAALGHSTSQELIGDMYHFGAGVPVNATEAVKWGRRAAEQGRALAQYNLGLMY